MDSSGGIARGPPRRGRVPLDFIDWSRQWSDGVVRFQTPRSQVASARRGRYMTGLAVDRLPMAASREIFASAIIPTCATGQWWRHRRWVTLSSSSWPCSYTLPPLTCCKPRSLSCAHKMKWHWNKTEMKLFVSAKTNAKTAVKRFRCFSQTEYVSAVCAPSHKQRIQTVIG